MTNTSKATFAAGCFWGIEHNFRQMTGVTDTRVGYIGGHQDNPTYQEVCAKTTGHAEAVEITFDPEIVSYETLLAAFWRMHNPTQFNRQGPDIGSQYRSAIFYHSEEQKDLAEISMKDVHEQQIWGKDPIVTDITEASTFWPAEEYHQQYVEKQGGQSCGI